VVDLSPQLQASSNESVYGSRQSQNYKWISALPNVYPEYSNGQSWTKNIHPAGVDTNRLIKFGCVLCCRRL